MKRTTILATLALAGFVFGIAGTVLAQTKTPVVRERQGNQHQRIKEGVKSGELTKREATKLRTEQAKIQAEKKMAKADGKVTTAERAVIKHDQNKASKHIYKEKHDAQKRK